MADTKLTALASLAALTDADILYAVDDPSGTPVERKVTAQVLKAFIGLPDILHVRQEETSGTNAATGSAATWNVRVLNTVKTNLITGASLATNQITLPAGTYRIRASAGAVDIDRHQLRFRNVTDGTTAVNGTSELSNDGDYSMTNSLLYGRFTIAAEKDFELQHYTELTSSASLGNATSSGQVEVYAEVYIEQEPA